MHRKGLADAARELLVRGIAMLGQCLGELGCERVAQQDEVVEALGRRPRRRKMIGGDVEVQESAGRMELHAEKLRWRTDVQRARGHGAVEDDLTVPRQLYPS